VLFNNRQNGIASRGAQGGDLDDLEPHFIGQSLRRFSDRPGPQVGKGIGLGESRPAGS
jgi:hypothetical protein